MKLLSKRKIINLNSLAFAIMLMFPIITLAQESNFGNWLICFGNKQINSKWNWHHEVQYRNRLYSGLGYKLNDSVRFELGYMNQFFDSSSRDQLNMISFVNF